ncbi:Cell surface protein [Acidisarcina polymorpha]|uniref:Cell surface protein n=1 Tax=Acidisarcina polymorpha TaxID=2211140 RepID=A0A2Z5FVP1_9BACT|nr:hypothetical protein [Acidisarcina polymorpha]AXC10959.1 Cell surface protein [Acidisarcina polymorpha]
MNASGTAAEYATYLSGSGGNNDQDGTSSETAESIAVDAEGEAYVLGSTSSVDFPTTSGVIQPTLPMSGGLGYNVEAFITKLNPTGSGLVWSTFFGEYGFARPRGIALDASKNVYITGSVAFLGFFNGYIPFPTTPASFQPLLPAPYTGFVSKLNPTASALVYSTFLGGSDTDTAEAIVVDESVVLT